MKKNRFCSIILAIALMAPCLLQAQHELGALRCSLTRGPAGATTLWIMLPSDELIQHTDGTKAITGGLLEIYASSGVAAYEGPITYQVRARMEPLGGMMPASVPRYAARAKVTTGTRVLEIVADPKGRSYLVERYINQEERFAQRFALRCVSK